MKKQAIFLLTAISGLVLFVIGGLLLKTMPLMASLPYPYILIGLGCGAFGHGTGSLINHNIMSKNPVLAKQKEINEKDERNLIISNKAKAKAYDCMVFVFGSLMLALALMDANMWLILLLVFSYLFVIGYGLYFRIKYDREM